MARVSRLSFIAPSIPTLLDAPPEGAAWLHEVKHDGFRTIIIIERGQVPAYTRNGFDWTDRYKHIAGAVAALPCRAAILDGEVVVQDKHGASDFEALQAALSSRRGALIFYAFDLLHLNGKDIRDRPLIERRAKLKTLLREEPTGRLQFSEEFIGDGAAPFRACAEHRLEGIVSKLAKSLSQREV